MLLVLVIHRATEVKPAHLPTAVSQSEYNTVLGKSPVSYFTRFALAVMLTDQPQPHTAFYQLFIPAFSMMELPGVIPNLYFMVIQPTALDIRLRRPRVMHRILKIGEHIAQQHCAGVAAYRG